VKYLGDSTGELVHAQPICACQVTDPLVIVRYQLLNTTGEMLDVYRRAVRILVGVKLVSVFQAVDYCSNQILATARRPTIYQTGPNYTPPGGFTSNC
jgi:hypothetical protein